MSHEPRIPNPDPNPLIHVKSIIYTLITVSTLITAISFFPNADDPEHVPTRSWAGPRPAGVVMAVGRWADGRDVTDPGTALKGGKGSQ